MYKLKKGHQPGVYVPLRALFLVYFAYKCFNANMGEQNVRMLTIVIILTIMSRMNML